MRPVAQTPDYRARIKARLRALEFDAEGGSNLQVEAQPIRNRTAPARADAALGKGGFGLASPLRFTLFMGE